MREFQREGQDPMLVVFGSLVSGMGGGRDTEQVFPTSDAEDMRSGARFIPEDVTLDRRAGKRVSFVQSCNSPCCWYWHKEDGTRVYHSDPDTYEQIGRANNGSDWTRESGIEAGACPQCGNAYVRGESVKTNGTISR